MRRTTSLLIVVVLMPVLLYVGFKGYLWYSVKNNVDEFRDAVAPFAQVDYRQIDVGWTTPSGPVGVRGITVKPTGMSDRVEIGSALVHTQSLRELYELARAFTQERVPDRLQVSVNRIVIDLNGQIGELLNQVESAGGWADLDTAGCGRKRFTAEDLMTMGYDRLVNNLNLRYNRARRSDGYVFSGKVRTDDMMSIDFEATIPEGLAAVRSVSSIPRLNDMMIRVTDLGYNARRNKFCAISMGVEPGEFVDDHVAAVKARLQELGFDPSDALATAYRSFTADSGEFALTVQPIDPLGIQDLATLEPSTLVEHLGLSLTYNDNVIETLFVAPAPLEIEDTKEAPKVLPDTYKPTPIASLGQHLKRQVKIYTHDGKFLHAYLDDVGAEQLTLTQHLVGGSATFSVAIDDISKVLVLY